MQYSTSSIDREGVQLSGESRESGPDGPWPVDAFRVHPLRHRVLRPSQPPEEAVYDADGDPRTLHLAVFGADGGVVAAGSLFPDDGWRIRGMATLPEHRGRGLGTRVLAGLLEGAADRGGGRVWCNARVTASGLYRRAGFEPEGDVFDLPPLGQHQVWSLRVPDRRPLRGFDPDDARTLLARTPLALDAWLRGLPSRCVTTPEAPGLWSVRDVVGHLAHGDLDDWIVRAEHIVGPDRERPFRPFERLAMVRRFHALSFDALLDTFARARSDALQRLARIDLSDETLALEGRHPVFGVVTLRQLLSAWVCHDLSHMAQIGRIAAKTFSPDVGPWSRFIRQVRD